MNKKLISFIILSTVSIMCANTTLFPNDKINNLGKGFANAIVSNIPNYQYYTNFDLCYKVVNVDFEKGQKTFYTGLLKGVNDPELKDNIITVCQDNLQDLRVKNHTTLKGTLK